MMNNWNGWNYGSAMMNGYQFGAGVFQFFGLMALVFVVWGLFWKGAALWKAARNGEKYWFIGLLLINTFGLLEILYIFLFTKGEKGINNLMPSSASSSAPSRRRNARKSK